MEKRTKDGRLREFYGINQQSVRTREGGGQKTQNLACIHYGRPLL